MGSIWAYMWRIAAAGLAFSVVVLLVLRWLPPPTSAFMLAKRWSGATVDYRWVPMKRISPYAALAVISSEDQKFFDHWGLDADAIADALNDRKTRGRLRGASTISQQVVKNLFLWPGRSYLRKGLEACLTVVMELLWSKQRILEIYLNIAELGRGVYGIEAAARRYFGTSAAHLSMHQAATLAAVLPSPERMHADRPSDYVRHRTWQIIEQMHGLGGLTFLKSAGLLNAKYIR